MGYLHCLTTVLIFSWAARHLQGSSTTMIISNTFFYFYIIIDEYTFARFYQYMENPNIEQCVLGLSLINDRYFRVNFIQPTYSRYIRPHSVYTCRFDGKHYNKIICSKKDNYLYNICDSHCILSFDFAIFWRHAHEHSNDTSHVHCNGRLNCAFYTKTATASITSTSPKIYTTTKSTETTSKFTKPTYSIFHSSTKTYSMSHSSTKTYSISHSSTKTYSMSQSNTTAYSMSLSNITAYSKSHSNTTSYSIHYSKTPTYSLSVKNSKIDYLNDSLTDVPLPENETGKDILYSGVQQNVAAYSHIVGPVVGVFVLVTAVLVVCIVWRKTRRDGCSKGGNNLKFSNTSIVQYNASEQTGDYISDHYDIYNYTNKSVVSDSNECLNKYLTYTNLSNENPTAKCIDQSDQLESVYENIEFLKR